MLILIDRKMPDDAKDRLSAFGEVLEFATEGITYEAISGHPDIFFCKTPAGLIVVPNLPDEYVDILNRNSINYIKGTLPVGPEYPESARFNTLVTERFIIQNSDIADPVIAAMNPSHLIINVRQGYVQCNLLALPNETFITSDRGIEKSLKQHKLDVIFIDASGVKLAGFEHGFFSGACGLHENTLFLCGNLSYFKEKELIKGLCSQAGVRIFELYAGQPVDVGTILFL